MPDGPPKATRSVGVLGVLADAVRVIGPSRKLLAVLVTLSLVVGILETVLVYLVGRLALSVSAGDDTAIVTIGPLQLDEPLRALAVVAGICVVTLALLSYPVALVASRLSARTLTRSRDRLIHSYLATAWEVRSRQREGHLQELIGQYTQRTERVVNQVSTLIVVGLSLVVLALGALVVSPVATFIGLVGLLVLGMLTRPASRRVKQWSSRAARLNKELASEVAQTSRVSLEVTSFDVGPEVERSLRRTVRRVSRSLARLRMLSRLTPSLYLYGALALVTIILAILVEVDSAELASIGPLMLLFVRGLGYGKQLQVAVQTSLEYSPYVHALESEIDALQGAPIQPGTVELEELGPVVFEAVSFEYVPGLPVLSDVALRIDPGVVLGVVGPSGGGKTTLSQLMLRLRQPTTGRILVGGIDLADVTPGSWAGLVAIVPQENKLIRATVADNIRFYRPELTDAEVVEAARLAHLHDELAALPDGYQTMIGPGERALSGGQSQRLGIARALVGGPAMLVLDEPTSALDARSEHLIRETLEDLRHHATLVIIAHRPATLEICDLVLRVDHGRVGPAPVHVAASDLDPTAPPAGSPS